MFTSKHLDSIVPVFDATRRSKRFIRWPKAVAEGEPVDDLAGANNNVNRHCSRGNNGRRAAIVSSTGFETREFRTSVIFH